MRQCSAGHLYVERLLSSAPAVGYGSGQDNHLSKFVAEKPPLKFRFPEAAIRH